jgi:hypothetical protein
MLWRPRHEYAVVVICIVVSVVTTGGKKNRTIIANILHFVRLLCLVEAVTGRQGALQ